MPKLLYDYNANTLQQFFKNREVRRELCKAIAFCGVDEGGTGLTSVATTNSASVTWSGNGTAASPLVATVVPIANTPNLLIAGTNASGTLVDGSANVITRPLTGFAATNAAIVATDTILAAFGKAQGQITARIQLSSPITGYIVGANTALAASDTILGAFGKVQGQINARITLASPLTGLSTATNDLVVATDSVVIGIGKLQAQVNSRAPLENAPLTGVPTAPTATTGTNTTQLATTAFVQSSLTASFITASSPPLTFGEVAANSFIDLGLTVTGATIGDVVAVGVPGAAQVDGAAFFAMVSNTNVVDIRCINPTTAPITVPEGTYKVTVFKI